MTLKYTECWRTLRQLPLYSYTRSNYHMCASVGLTDSYSYACCLLYRTCCVVQRGVWYILRQPATLPTLWTCYSLNGPDNVTPRIEGNYQLQIHVVYNCLRTFEANVNIPHCCIVFDKNQKYSRHFFCAAFLVRFLHTKPLRYTNWYRL